MNGQRFSKTIIIIAKGYVHLMTCVTANPNPNLVESKDDEIISEKDACCEQVVSTHATSLQLLSQTCKSEIQSKIKLRYSIEIQLHLEPSEQIRFAPVSQRTEPVRIMDMDPRALLSVRLVADFANLACPSAKFQKPRHRSSVSDCDYPSIEHSGSIHSIQLSIKAELRSGRSQIERAFVLAVVAELEFAPTAKALLAAISGGPRRRRWLRQRRLRGR